MNVVSKSRQTQVSYTLIVNSRSSKQHELTNRNLQKHIDLGIACFRMRDLDEAQRHFEMAIEVSSELFGSADHRTGIALLLSARVFREKGNLPEAACLSEKGHKILSKGRVDLPFGGSAGFWSLLGY